MNQRSSALARALAVTALVAGFLVLVVVIAGSHGGGSAGPRGGSPGTRTTPAHRRHAPASYVVQNGDTLTSIANRTGVSVARIQRLNPGVDPQILIAGEKLKLR